MTRKGCRITDFCGHILWDIANMVMVACQHFDGIGVIGIVRFCFQGTFELSEIFVNIVSVRDSGNIEFYNVKLAIILWPDADVVAFVLDAEVLEILNGCVRITTTDNDFHFWLCDGITTLVQ